MFEGIFAILCSYIILHIVLFGGRYSCSENGWRMCRRKEYAMQVRAQVRISFLTFLFQFLCLFSYSQIVDSVNRKDSIHYHLAITSAGSYNQSEKASTYLMNNAVRLNATHRLFSVNVFG